jgi:hypothetical protein
MYGSFVISTAVGKYKPHLHKSLLINTYIASPLLGTPSVQSIHDYYTFALEDVGRLAPMAAELVDRLAILIVRRFLGMGAMDSLHCVLIVMSTCNISFVDLLMFSVPFRWFLLGDDVRREIVHRLSTSLHGTLGSYLRHVTYLVWHAFMFLVLKPVGFPPSFFLFAWWYRLLFLI